jgi:ankyrin repeat protein
MPTILEDLITIIELSNLDNIETNLLDKINQYLSNSIDILRNNLNLLLLNIVNSNTDENKIIKVISIILNNGVDINTIDLINNMTPLMYAVKNKKHIIIKLLLENNANVSLVNNIGSTALQIAAHNLDIDSIQLLLSKILPITNSTAQSNLINDINIAFIEAIKEGKTESQASILKNILTILKQAGADINFHYNTNLTPLIYAIKNGVYTIVEFLLSKGANVNLTYDDYPPLYYAIYNYSEINPDTEIIRILLDKGANRYQLDGQGRTMINFATSLNFNKLSDFIETYNTDKSVQNKYFKYKQKYLKLKKLMTSI